MKISKERLRQIIAEELNNEEESMDSYVDRIKETLNEMREKFGDNDKIDLFEEHLNTISKEGK